MIHKLILLVLTGNLFSRASGQQDKDTIIAKELDGVLVTATRTGKKLSNVAVPAISPDYVLILIDGEPLVGRNGGVLDLNRITVNNNPDAGSTCVIVALREVPINFSILINERRRNGFIFSIIDW